MRRMALTAVLAGTTLLAPVLIPSARASYNWFSIGSVFRVGAAHIAFVFGRPFGYPAAYYYRYDRPVYFAGYHCSRYCFRDGGYFYHHESCPLVGAYFNQYRVDPYWAFDRYAPRYDGYRDGYGGYGYDGRYGGGYDRYDDRDRYDRRYDRYDDRYRYDGRSDRYDRSDRHHRRRHHDRRRHY